MLDVPCARVLPTGRCDEAPIADDAPDVADGLPLLRRASRLAPLGEVLGRMEVRDG